MKGAVPGTEVGGEDEDFEWFGTSETYRWTARIGYMLGTLRAEDKGVKVQGDYFFGVRNSSMVVQVCWKGCQ